MARETEGWIRSYSSVLDMGLTPAEMGFWHCFNLLANPLRSRYPGLIDLGEREIAERLHCGRWPVRAAKQKFIELGLIELVKVPRKTAPIEGIQILNFGETWRCTAKSLPESADAQRLGAPAPSPPEELAPQRPGTLEPDRVGCTPTSLSKDLAPQRPDLAVHSQVLGRLGAPAPRFGGTQPSLDSEPRSVEVVEGATIEVEKTRARQDPPTDDEKQIIDEVLRNLKGWDVDYSSDLSWVRDIRRDYPVLSLLVLKGCRDKYEDLTKRKRDWKNTIRNWLRVEVRIQDEEKENGSAQKKGRLGYGRVRGDRGHAEKTRSDSGEWGSGLNRPLVGPGSRDYEREHG